MEPTSIYSELGHCRILDLSVPVEEAVDLAELCDRVMWDEEARVVLVKFGPELNALLESNPGSGPVVGPLAKLKPPVIAAIRGDAIGIGLELALACDFRIGIESARFGLPQVAEGSVPCNGGTQRLPRLIGQAKAMHMLLTGESIDAGEACRIGLIHRIVPAESLESTALAIAQEMASRSPLSLSYVKEALYSGRDLTLDQGLRMELDLYLLLFTTKDRVEGISAFREKRKPEFLGN